MLPWSPNGLPTRDQASRPRVYILARVNPNLSNELQIASPQIGNTQFAISHPPRSSVLSPPDISLGVLTYLRRAAVNREVSRRLFLRFGSTALQAPPTCCEKLRALRSRTVTPTSAAPSCMRPRWAPAPAGALLLGAP